MSGRMEDYNLLRCIGKGSFGKVYLVRHKRERKHYCMKVIKLKGIPRKEREATRNEVMLLQKLMHPNIVAYKDSFFAHGRDQLCIAMTYCDGGDLEQLVNGRRRKLWKEDQILHYFVQVRACVHRFVWRAALTGACHHATDCTGHPLHAPKQSAAS